MGFPRRTPATSKLSDRDLGLLAWMGEQYGARIDHLLDLLGVSKTRVWKIVWVMRDAELVRTERIVVGHPTWVVPTAAGLAACGLSYKVWTPVLGSLLHIGAINDVRVHVQAQRPDSRWIPARQLELEMSRSMRRGRHLPDAVLILDGTSVAMEVELTPKTRQSVTAVLNHHTRRFDSIMYYCAPQAYRQMTRLEATGRWPKLVVRELPLPRYLRER